MVETAHRLSMPIRAGVETHWRLVWMYSLQSIFIVEFNKRKQMLVDIKDISFPHLRKLFIRMNCIESVEVLSRIDMPSMENLWLSTYSSDDYRRHQFHLHSQVAEEMPLSQTDSTHSMYPYFLRSREQNPRDAESEWVICSPSERVRRVKIQRQQQWPQLCDSGQVRHAERQVLDM